MNKVAKSLRALYWIARKPVLLNRVLSDPDQWESHVNRNYPHMTALPVIGMEQVVKSSSLDLGPMTFLDGGSLPTDMMLLAGLAESIPACRYFEIGTWRGESAAVVSSRAKSCHTLSLSADEMRHMGVPESSIAQHAMFSQDLDRVHHLEGNSKTFDFAGLNQTFDLIFIDGDHHYDAIVSDTRQVFQHLVHEKSIVVWHDYGYHPDTIRYETLAAILDALGPDRAQQLYHVGHTKAAIYTGLSYPSREASFPMSPRETYQLKLSRKSLT